MNEIKDLLEQYYDLSWDIFTEEMADFMNHTKVKQLEEKRKNIEEQIIQFSKSDNAYDTFTSIIEDKNPDAFNIMIANIDSNPDKYQNLNDIFEEFNNIHKSKVTFPYIALQNVIIKK